MRVNSAYKLKRVEKYWPNFVHMLLAVREQTRWGGDEQGCKF